MKITQKKYAEIMGQSPAAIRYRIQNNVPMPGVKSIKREGNRVYIYYYPEAVKAFTGKPFQEKN